MIQVDLRGDMTAALRAVDNVSSSVKAASTARALNRAATTVRATARTEIRKRYNIAAGKINKVIQIRPASASRLEALVYAKDKRLPLSSFSTSVLRRSGNVTVSVLKGRGRKVVKGNPNLPSRPFKQVVGSGGHVGIFQRGPGNARRPYSKPLMTELFSIAIPSGLTNKMIGRILRRVATERFNAEFKRELSFRAGRGR